MCGRYTLSAGHEALARAFLAEFAEELQMSWKPRYNISPGSGIVAILEDRDKGGRRAEVLHWGLVPSWAKDASIGYKLTNSRAETIRDKPAFRDAFRYRRCLVPASGFYEWDRTTVPRQPYYFYPEQQDFMAIAGIWEHWLHPTGSEILSVSLITTAANREVGKIHHRMPVVLDRENWSKWLDTGNVKGDGLADLMVPAAGEVLRSHPVSTVVNTSGEDGPELIARKAPDSASSSQLDLF